MPTVCISFLTMIIIINFILWLLLKVIFDLKEAVLTNNPLWVPNAPGSPLAFGWRPASFGLLGEVEVESALLQSWLHLETRAGRFCLPDGQSLACA